MRAADHAKMFLQNTDVYTDISMKEKRGTAWDLMTEQQRTDFYLAYVSGQSYKQACEHLESLGFKYFC